MNIMYAGKIIERGESAEIYSNPRHPYTVGLINSIPRVNSNQKKLSSIPGTLKTFSDFNYICPFIERCKFADQKCSIGKTKLNEIKKNHFSLCLYPERLNQKI